MAKESMKAREVKRAKLVAKYAAKRAQLKAEGNYEALQSLPKNASPVPKDISANLAFLVSNSVKWHRQDLSPA